ncbi:MAG: CoA-binding protein [Chloroflexi bacterium]|nr:CoA-binding protein [Chloroflexota bacterium]
MSNSNGFGKGFPPKNIAIVGVSRTDHFQHPGYTGYRLLQILKDGGFSGNIYPVNPKADFIDGLRAYPTVSAIPEPVDLVIVTVPAHIVPQTVEDCVAAGAANVQICTSGFAETGQEGGQQLSNEVLQIAQGQDIRVVGPNCMGFHVPSAKMQMFEEMPMNHGPMGFLSQSGGHARVFLLNAENVGIGVSKVISYGNALMLDAPDFLDYLADDPETRIIGMYLEGIKDGRRFADAVQRVSLKKPVIIWKGGLTEAGARAARSHTASLAGEKQVWEAFFKQTGAIKVGSIEEMVETAISFLNLKPSTGRRAAVISAGGGDTVAAGDMCAEEGIEVPSLSLHTQNSLLEHVYLINQGIMNPLDLPIVVHDLSIMRQAIPVLADDPQIDAIILRIGSLLFVLGDPFPTKDEVIECLLELQQQIGDKPILIPITNDTKEEPVDIHVRDLREAGLTAYASFRGACRAFHRFTTYHRYVSESTG